jgi:hypothetical protein
MVPTQPVNVSASRDGVLVNLAVGSRCASLSPREARLVAIQLLQEAERREQEARRRVDRGVHERRRK